MGMGIRRIVFALAIGQVLYAQGDGTIIERKPHTFTPFGELKGVQRYATAEEYAETLGDRRYNLERVTYASDGLKVVAYVYGSAAPNLPVVVFVRGGYLDTAVSLYAVEFRKLAQAGFKVVAPMLRQSEGAPGVDQLGGADLNDLMAASKLVQNLGGDVSKMYLYGESRGGMMVYQALRDGFPARAAAVIGAYTDQVATLELQSEMKPVVEKLWSGEKWDQAIERRSAIRWADKIKVPILIMHGGMDSLTPLHSLRMATKLQELGKPYQLMIFEGDGHVLPRHREARHKAAIEWFKGH